MNFLFQPDLVRSFGYPIEEHTVQTEDGYIVTLHRIPHGLDSNNEFKERPAVLLAHSLLGSSVVFTFGPTNQVGFDKISTIFFSIYHVCLF